MPPGPEITGSIPYAEARLAKAVPDLPGCGPLRDRAGEDAIERVKGIPIAGGVVGAGVDATLTALVGRAAKANFPAHL